MSQKISEFIKTEQIEDDSLIPIVQNSDNFTIRFSNFLERIKVKLSDLKTKVIDNLTTEDHDSALSAYQGFILKEEKVDKILGKGLSTNDFDNDAKNKLKGIEVGAQKNPNLKTIGGESIIGVGDIPISAFGKVVDDLETFDGGLPLSAKQGVILNRPATILNKGLVKPDGISIKITDDGTIYAGKQEALSYKTFVFKQSDSEPITPNINDNGSLSNPDPSQWVVGPDSPYKGWVDYPTDDKKWWMSTGVVDGKLNKVTIWSKPMNISGIPGKDGRFTEFRFSIGNFITYPTFNKDPNNQSAPNNNSLWSISIPSDVPITKTIWMTQSISEGGQYSEWSIPVKIKGENGKDGESVENIFMSTEDSAKPYRPESINEDQYVPNNWTADPIGINSISRYEWISTRRKINNVWGQFSEPTLWSYYAKDGEDGKMPNWKTYIFKQSLEIPETPNFVNLDELNNRWDNNPQLGLNIWMSIGTVNGITGQILEWTIPMKITGEKGEGSEWTDFKFGKGTILTAPSINANNEDPGVNWKDTIDELGSINYEIEAIWMTSCRISNEGVYGKWSSPKRITAEDGKDGKGIEFIFKLSKTNLQLQTPIAPINNPSLDDNYPNDWTDDQQGVNSVWKYEWCSSRKKQNGIWSEYSTPAIWATYSEDGEDGSTTQFIFKLSNLEVKPTKPSYSNTDTIPSEWTETPKGVTSDNKYEWVCSRVKKDGTWGDWGDVGLFAKYSINGTDGVGFATSYLGEWKDNFEYEGSESIRQIVKHKEKYYWTKLSAGKIPIGITPLVDQYWEYFNDQYENLATGFLFAEEALIGGFKITDKTLESTFMLTGLVGSYMSSINTIRGVILPTGELYQGPWLGMYRRDVIASDFIEMSPGIKKITYMNWYINDGEWITSGVPIALYDKDKKLIWAAPQNSVTVATPIDVNITENVKYFRTTFFSYAEPSMFKCDLYGDCPSIVLNGATGNVNFGGMSTSFNADGSGFLAGGGLSWDHEGNMAITGSYKAINGRRRIEINPDENDVDTISLEIVGGNGYTYGAMYMNNIRAALEFYRLNSDGSRDEYSTIGQSGVQLYGKNMALVIQEGAFYYIGIPKTQPAEGGRVWSDNGTLKITNYGAG